MGEEDELREEREDFPIVGKVVGEALPFVHDVARVLGFVAGGVVVAEVAGGVYQGRDFLCSRFVEVYVEWNFFQRHTEVDVYEGTVGVLSDIAVVYQIVLCA